MSSEVPIPRRIGEVRGSEDGPTVVLVGGIHGNEPAGVAAAAEVMGRLTDGRHLRRGRVVALMGNRGALARRVRYITRDLNRGWTRGGIAALGAADVTTLADEDREQREIADEISALEASRTGPLVFFDLHTTSGPSQPFVCFSDTLANRALALELGVTAILGLEETIEGSLLGYCADRGHAAIAFEAGQHDDPLTRLRHVAAVWTILGTSGLLTGVSRAELLGHYAELTRAADGAPRVVQVLYRHVVAPSDTFEMVPGFRSFQHLRAGDVVARDQRGEIRAPVGGLMLMPRYQPTGEDGYFVVGDVRPAWLSLSKWLRGIGAERILPWLPGVERDATGRRLVIDPHIARTHVVDVMHLFGYRRSAPEGGRLVFTRRVG